MRTARTPILAMASAVAAIYVCPERPLGQRLTWMNCHAIFTGRFLGEQLLELASSYGQARAGGAAMRADLPPRVEPVNKLVVGEPSDQPLHFV